MYVIRVTRWRGERKDKYKYGIDTQFKLSQSVRGVVGIYCVRLQWTRTSDTCILIHICTDNTPRLLFYFSHIRKDICKGIYVKVYIHKGTYVQKWDFRFISVDRYLPNNFSNSPYFYLIKYESKGMSFILKRLFYPDF